jgi:hypothetical protein
VEGVSGWSECLQVPGDLPVWTSKIWMCCQCSAGWIMVVPLTLLFVPIPCKHRKRIVTCLPELLLRVAVITTLITLSLASFHAGMFKSYEVLIHICQDIMHSTCSTKQINLLVAKLSISPSLAPRTCPNPCPRTPCPRLLGLRRQGNTTR